MYIIRTWNHTIRKWGNFGTLRPRVNLSCPIVHLLSICVINTDKRLVCKKVGFERQQSSPFNILARVGVHAIVHSCSDHGVAYCSYIIPMLVRRCGSSWSCWRFLFFCNLVALLFDLVSCPHHPHMQRGSGDLSGISCHMGQGWSRISDYQSNHN